MKRREFLKAVSAPALVSMSGKYNLNNQKKKIQLGCFNRPWNRFPLEQTLDGVESTGFRGVGFFRRPAYLEINSSNAEEKSQFLKKEEQN